MSAAAGAAPTPISLRNWMENEAETNNNPQPHQDINNAHDGKKSNKESIIRRTTVACGIAELLNRSSTNNNAETGEEHIIKIDNFIVHVSNEEMPSHRTWDDIRGVAMISSGVAVTVEEPSYLSALLEGGEEFDGHMMGRCLEVELTPPPVVQLGDDSTLTTEAATGGSRSGSEQTNNNRCQLFARLLYELFTNESFPTALDGVDSTAIPPQKRAKKSNDVSSRKKLMLSRAKGDFDRAELPFQMPCIVRMQEMGIPSSICLMTQNLLECAMVGDDCQSDNAYESLGVLCEDLHLLLLDPDRFLFDNDDQSVDNLKLLYREDKLYGRDKEETLITDAFCRVSRGESEAFFIGGFSGSGKSMLVNSLTDRVHCVGGYSIKHKFDAISQEKPLSGVISAFNQVCLMIKVRDRPAIAEKLRAEFGVDFRLLMRLLPNVSVLFPEFVSPAFEVDDADAMNAGSVSFTLLRFVRVVSSPRHPIMLFLDDIQWADSTALEKIHAILSDTMGSCMFFVGTYRENEVPSDHDVFDLMAKLEISNVRTTKINLDGLNQENLNTIISDALCLYPRITKSLSTIVYQKTKGNPFFALEFMKSLKSRDLLQYNFHQKRWVWNEDLIRGEDITDNVLHLLTRKMNGLSDDLRLLLKVMACLGSSTNEAVIDYLSASAEYSGVGNGLERAVHDGFIEKDGEGHFKFVHDKVREAAYNLIPNIEKKQFHYNLGKVLHSICDGNYDVGDTIFLIATQINHGKQWILADKEQCIAIAELNMKAGTKALDGCDHKTAYSYLSAALLWLPDDHWESHYDLSLRLSFLVASTANSCCQYEEAEQMLRRISGRTKCFEDKLSSYFLLAQIFQAQGKVVDAYNTCSFVLLQLGETIPKSFTPEAAKTIVKDTLAMYGEIYNDDWLETKMEDNTSRTIVKFYSAIVFLANFCKSYSMVVYFTCKAVQLSLQNGPCVYTPLSLLQLIGFAMEDEDASELFIIAKNALSLLERFDAGGDQVSGVFINFYGRIAWRFVPIQECGDNLRRGFETGLSAGSHFGFHCAFHAIKAAIISGTNLPSLLKEIDYYLHLLKTRKSELMKNALLICRETVSELIDKGHATSIDAEVTHDLDREPVFFHQAYRAYWLGHGVRCHHLFDKCSQLSGLFLQFNPFLLKFYHALNSLDILKKKKNHTTQYKRVVRDAISALTNAANKSDWNFTNKLRLLQAEQQSLTKQHMRSIELYDASIACAKKSGFIHEQGLACEKAGFYFKNVDGDKQKALLYLTQARECYEEWGSSMKVDFIQKELDDLNLNHNDSSL